MGGLDLVLDLANYRPGVLTVGFFASAVAATAVAVVASRGRTVADDPAIRRAFATNVVFVVLVMISVGARHASGSMEQATAVLRLGMAALAGLGPASLDFIARLVGIRLGAMRVTTWGSALVLGALTAFTDKTVVMVSQDGDLRRGGPLVWVLLAFLLVHIYGGIFLAHRRMRRTASVVLYRQLRSVIIAYAVGSLGAIDLLRLMGTPLPPISFLFLGASVAILGHAFRAYHLLGAPDLGWRALAWLSATFIAAVPVALVLVASDGWWGWTRPVFAAVALEGLYLVTRAYVGWVQPAIDDLFMRRRRDLEHDLDELAETLLVTRTLPALAAEVDRFLGRSLYVRPALFLVAEEGGGWRALDAGPAGRGALPAGCDGFIAELARRPELWTRERADALRPSALRDQASRLLAANGAEVLVPLSGPGRTLLGILAVAPRADRAPFVPVEVELLSRLGPVVAESISSARLYDRREALRVELEERVAARAAELAQTREMLEQARDDIVRREKMATLGLIVGGVAADLEAAVAAAAVTVPGLQADAATCSAAAARVQAARPDLSGEEVEHVQRDLGPLVAAIVEGSRRASAIARSVSRFAQPSGERSERVDLVREIDAALTLLEPELIGRVEVTRELEPDLPPVEGDAGGIGQVLLNLLSNAAQAISGRGTIAIRARRLPDDRVEIAVRDSGEGIAPDNLGRIFEPFFTTKADGTRGGSGLGLFVSYGIVQNHGGELTAESEPGVGTELRLRLPVTSRSQ